MKVFFDPLPNDKDPSQFKTKISAGFALASLLRCLHGFLPDHNDVRKIDYGSFDGTQPIAEVCESIFRRNWHFDLLSETDISDLAEKPVRTKGNRIA